MNGWWPAILGLYLLWSWHRYGIRRERMEVSASTVIMDMFAVPGWIVTIIVFKLVRQVMRLVFPFDSNKKD